VRRYWAYLRVGAGLALVLILVWYHYDAAVVIKQLSVLRVRWIVLASVAILAATCLGAVNTYLLVSREGELTLWRFMPLYWTAWAVSLVVPGQVGDVASLTAMLRRHGLEWHAGLGRVLLDKIISFLVIVLFAVAGLLSLSDVDSWHGRDVAPMIVVLLVLAIVAYLARRRLREMFNTTRPGLRGFIGRSIAELGYTAYRHPKRVSINCTLTFAKMGLIGFAYWCMFAAFGQLGVRIWQVVALSATSSLVAYIPVSFNGIGTAEVTGIYLFSALAIPQATTLSVYLILRLIVFVLAWAPVAVWLAGWKQAGDLR
jgi:uncharacterized membrane protein YbhN (UPF0104 family)